MLASANRCDDVAFAEVSPIASVVLRRLLVGPRSLCVDCRLYLVRVLLEGAFMCSYLASGA